MRISDWSSDVCSSDLTLVGEEVRLADVEVEVDRIEGDDRGQQRGGVAGAARDQVADADAVEADPAGHRCADLGIGQVQLGGPHVRLCNLQVGTGDPELLDALVVRSEEHTSELQSLMRISYAAFCV